MVGWRGAPATFGSASVDIFTDTRADINCTETKTCGKPSLTAYPTRATNVLTAAAVGSHQTGNSSAWPPVTRGFRFGDWEVTWLGGWTRDRLSYVVMAVKNPTAKMMIGRKRRGPVLGVAGPFGRCPHPVGGEK